jgi:hypothetical protein
MQWGSPRFGLKKHDMNKKVPNPRHSCTTSFPCDTRVVLISLTPLTTTRGSHRAMTVRWAELIGFIRVIMIGAMGGEHCNTMLLLLRRCVGEPTAGKATARSPPMSFLVVTAFELLVLRFFYETFGSGCGFIYIVAVSLTSRKCMPSVNTSVLMQACHMQRTNYITGDSQPPNGAVHDGPFLSSCVRST